MWKRRQRREKKGRITILQVELEDESMQRLAAMKDLAEADDYGHVVLEALHLYETALKEAASAEHKGGVVYLTTKFPDGSTKEEPVFKIEADA